MVNITKKTFLYILCSWLAFSSAFITYQKSYSYAMEWAGVTIALDTALKALLGTLGITAGVGMASEVDWGAVRNDCIAFQENQGNTAVEVGEWWSDIISGSLNTASGCWDSFKEWASSLTANNETSNSTELISSYIEYALNYLGFDNINVELNGSYDNVYAMIVAFFPGHNDYSIRLYRNNGIYTYNGNTNNSSSNVLCDGNGYLTIYKTQFNSNTTVINSLGSESLGHEFQYDALSYAMGGHASLLFFNFANVVRQEGEIVANIPFEDIYSPSISNTIFNSIDNSVINNLDIINQGDTVIEGDTIINLPWERVGDTASEVEEVIQGLIDRVNDGTLSLENYTENIQNITNTYVYDITNNHIFPDPDNNDETIEDKINENKSNEGFTLFGLERFFPFCIPWDLYAFLGLLEAEPEAPQINIPFPDPVTKEIDVYVLDLSPLEPVAMVLRYGFDLLFIIGLALATRRLIGAGGD